MVGDKEKEVHKVLLALDCTKKVIEEAKRNANSIVHEALVTAQKTENEANLLKKRIMVYKAKLRSEVEILTKIIQENEEI